MAHRQRRASPAESVGINLTAMLDMAFQLLAFFVLTFRPAPIEGQIDLRMPPLAAASGPVIELPDPGDIGPLVVTVLPDATGGLGTIRLLETPIGNLASLDRSLTAGLRDQGSPFEQVLIQVGPNLRYDALMSVVDVCTRQQLPGGKTLTKLRLLELPEGQAG